jgi:hypothetical protein
MMARFKDFGSGKDRGKKEPVSFALYGEDFQCVSEVQGRVILNLVADGASGDPAASSRMISSFFKSVLEDESYERFDALLNDKHKVVNVETLSEIVSWLMEEYGDRPNQQPED